MTLAYQIMVFTILLVAAVVPPPVKADDTTVGSPNDEIKCGDCPCGTTCYTSPPPPPKPSPPPPSPPPPPKKQPPTPGGNCPPPPSRGGGGGQSPPDYIYITGPPGDLYPVDQTASAGRRCLTPVVEVISGLLLGMLGFW